MAVGAPGLPAEFVVMGVDPGPVNMGLCVYEAVGRRVLDGLLVRLTDDSRATSVGELIERLTQLCRPDGQLGQLMARHRVSLTVVENQASTGNHRQICLQDTLHALIGPASTRVVQPSAVKERFRRWFPPIGAEHRAAVKHPAAAQQRANKRAAVENGRQFFPDGLRAQLEALRAERGAEEHRLTDVYDAFWTARYGAERELEERWDVVYPGFSTRTHARRVLKKGRA